MSVRLREVNKWDYEYLYELLKEKTPEQNISHKELPSYEDHVAFNEAKPYIQDFIIVVYGDRVGRVYITKQDEIGIHIGKAHRKNGYASEVVDMLMQKRKLILANISPKNKASIKFFEKKGFTPLQITYKYEG